MLRFGAILLTIWTGFNLVLAVCMLFAILVLGKNAPAMMILYGDTHAIGMDPRALATINALAVIFNAAAAALCALSLAVIWFALLRRARWAFGLWPVFWALCKPPVSPVTPSFDTKICFRISLPPCCCLSVSYSLQWAFHEISMIGAAKKAKGWKIATGQIAKHHEGA